MKTVELSLEKYTYIPNLGGVRAALDLRVRTLI